MRRRILDAARLAKLDEGDGAEEASFLKKLERKDLLDRLQKSARTLTDMHDQLADPPLPSAAQAKAWWPEPERPRSARLLVSPRDPSPRARAVGSARRSAPHRPGTAPGQRGIDAPGASLVFLANQPVGGRGAPPSALAGGEELALDNHAAVLSQWMDSYTAGEEEFASKAVFVEMRLRQALSSSVALGVPNTFRTAVVCDAFERVAPMTGRCEGVLVLIWASSS